MWTGIRRCSGTRWGSCGDSGAGLGSWVLGSRILTCPFGSLLFRMKLSVYGLAGVAALLVLTGCASIAPPQPPSLDLPKPPSDLKAVRKGDSVTLTWSVPTLTTDRQRARSLGVTRICRSAAALTQCGTPVGQVNPPASSSNKNAAGNIVATCVDSIPSEMQSDNADAFALFAIEVQNADGRSAGLSNVVRVPLIRTLAPPQNFQAHVVKEGVALSWTGGSAPSIQDARVQYKYRIYRRQEGTAGWMLAGEAVADKAGDYSLTDSSIEWEKTYDYRAAAATVLQSQPVESADTPEVKVFADDVFPPAVPSGLQAVFSGPGQAPFVDLIWSPVPDVDLAGYNVYRHEEGAAAMKVNREMVKSPAYRDAGVSAGKHYFYAVSSVDARGNESSRSEEAEESVP